MKLHMYVCGMHVVHVCMYVMYYIPLEGTCEASCNAYCMIRTRGSTHTCIMY
jgi:hypothetical protein